MTENARRLTMAHEQALAEAVRVYGNLQTVSFGLSTEGRLIDEAMSIIAAIVGENLSESRPGKFIPKNGEVEAITVAEAHTLAGTDFWAMPKWLIAAHDDGDVLFLNGPTRINVRTTRGWLTANNGEWLVRDFNGLSPWDAESFWTRYERKPEVEKANEL